MRLGSKIRGPVFGYKVFLVLHRLRIEEKRKGCAVFIRYGALRITQGGKRVRKLAIWGARKKRADVEDGPQGN